MADSEGGGSPPTSWLTPQLIEALRVAAVTVVGYGVVDRILQEAARRLMAQRPALRAMAHPVRWSTKTLALLHATVLTCAGVRVLRETGAEMIDSSAPSLPLACGLSIGYFMCDTVSMYRNYCVDPLDLLGGGGGGDGGRRAGGTVAAGNTLRAFLRGNWLMVVHHALMAGLFIPVPLVLNRGHYIAGRMMLAELPTALVFIRWFLAQAGLKNSPVDLINSAAVLVSWWFTRVWVFPSLYLQLAATRGLSLAQTINQMSWMCHVGSTTIVAPQLYWLSLMMRSLHQVVTKGKIE